MELRWDEGTAVQSDPTRDTLEIEPHRAEELKRRLRETSPPAAPPSRRARPSWHLEAIATDGGVRVVPLHPLPFRIGRRPGLELVLTPDSVSKVHAEIYEKEGQLHIRDLQSTNGTFVNGEFVEDGPIREGDTVHLGEVEFRVGVPTPPAPEPPEVSGPGTTVSLGRRPRGAREIAGAREMQELLREGRVTIAFQPIVRIPGGVPEAYEALGRGAHPGLPQSPLDLLDIAESLGLVGELSRLFRKKAVELVRDRPNFPTLFLNTHPAELKAKDLKLLESLEELRGLAPHLDLALEIHEKALEDFDYVTLKKMLSESNIGLAYDDFGAGQARLLELAAAPPHYLKFDRRFVQNIHEPDLINRRQLLSSLVGVARDLRVKAIAEGIEKPEEAAACEEIGFQLAQGYHFGRPAPIDTITG